MCDEISFDSLARYLEKCAERSTAKTPDEIDRYAASCARSALCLICGDAAAKAEQGSESAARLEKAIYSIMPWLEE